MAFKFFNIIEVVEHGTLRRNNADAIFGVYQFPWHGAKFFPEPVYFCARIGAEQVMNAYVKGIAPSFPARALAAGNGMHLKYLCPVAVQLPENAGRQPAHTGADYDNRFLHMKPQLLGNSRGVSQTFIYVNVLIVFHRFLVVRFLPVEGEDLKKSNIVIILTIYNKYHNGSRVLPATINSTDSAPCETKIFEHSWEFAPDVSTSSISRIFSPDK